MASESDDGIIIVGEGQTHTTDSGQPSGQATDAQAQDETTGSMTANMERDSSVSDPVANQRIRRSKSGDFDREELEGLLDTSWLKNRVVNDYAQYATKEGAEFPVSLKDEENDQAEKQLQENIRDYVERHNLFSVANELIEEERGTGDGLILPMITESTRGEVTFADPLNLNRVKKIEGFNVIGALDVESFVVNLDPLSTDYKDVGQAKVKRNRGGNVNFDGEHTQPVNSDRFVHLRTRWSESNPQEGLSVFRRARTVLMALLNAEWATGQILFRAVYKVLQTDLSQFDDMQQRNMAEQRLSREWDSLSLSIIDKEDEMQMLSAAQNTGGLGQILEFMKDLMSASWAYPKSMLFGAQSGTLSASDRDAKNFFQGIEGFQEAHLAPIMKELVKIGFKADENGVDNQIDGKLYEWDDVDVSVDWNQIFEISRQDKAQIKKTEAQAEQLTTQKFRSMIGAGLLTSEQAASALEEAGIHPGGDLPDADAQGVVSPPIGQTEQEEEEESEEEQSPKVPDPSQNGNGETEPAGTSPI